MVDENEENQGVPVELGDYKVEYTKRGVFDPYTGKGKVVTERRPERKRVSPLKAYKTSSRERRQSAIARKAISLVAPSGSLIKAITKPSKKKGSRGRGRPRGTYKARYLPSGRVVKVPTHIYKKMLSAEKAQIRLARVQRQMEAEQIAMQQDPRFQPGAEEQFLAEPDQLHEAEVLRAQQQAEMEQLEAGVSRRPRVPQRIVKGAGIFGRGVSRLGEVTPPQRVDQFGRPAQLQTPQRFPVVDMTPREPRVTVLGKSSLLNISGGFNNPNQSLTPWKKRRSY